MIVLSAQERAELISCIEAGDAARRLDVDHGATLHLVGLQVGDGYERTSALKILHVEAWWDGWEEAHRSLTRPSRVLDQGTGALPFLSAERS